jgi:ABC-type multidrug transport system ATPase subunit
MATASIGVEPYPFLVMLDEPLAGLDSEGIARVLELMREARARGIALMISEHRQEILEFSFDFVLKLPYIPNAGDQVWPIQSHEEFCASVPTEAEIILRATKVVGGYATSPVECPSFTVVKESVVIIRGPNGSGKTGFVRSLLGRPGTVLSGLLEFEGEIISDLRLAHQQSRVRYLSQKRDLFPDLSVQESIEVAGRNHKSHLSDEIGEIIDRLGPRKLVRHLSSGGRTLLGLAQALAGAPRLLILDEPLANTDRDNGERIRVLIDRACKLGNMAVIVIEHDAMMASGSEVYQIEIQGSIRTLTKVNG